jgi:hypothetical protein
MAKARVVLEKALSHDCRGRSFRQGEPHIIDNEADIAYYQTQPEFSVTLLKAPAPKPAPAPEPEPEDDEDEAPEAPPVVHTAESLGKLTKGELVSIAANEPYNLALEPDMKKGDMIEAMLLATEDKS